MVELKDEATVQHSRKSQMMTGVVEMNTQHTHDNNLSTEESDEHFIALTVHVQECKRALFEQIFTAKNNLA